MTKKDITSEPHPAIKRAMANPQTAEALNAMLSDLTKLLSANTETPSRQLAELVIAGFLTRGWRPNGTRPPQDISKS